MTEPPPEEPPTEPETPAEPLPPIPRETPPDDVITALGFVPGDTRAVVITSTAVVGVARSIPDVENPPTAYPGEPEPTTRPRSRGGA